MTSDYKRISIVVSIIVMLFHAASGFAAEQTWTGGAGTMNFNDPANWSGVGPQPGDYMKFDAGGVYQATNVIEITASCQISGIIFQRGAALSVNIADGAILTIDDTGFAFNTIVVPSGETTPYSVTCAGSGAIVALGHLGIGNHGSGGLTVGAPLVIDNGRDIRIWGSQPVTVSGAVSGMGYLGVTMEAADDVVTLTGTTVQSGGMFVQSGTLKLMKASGVNNLSVTGSSGILEIGVPINAANWNPKLSINNGTLRVSAAGTVIDRDVEIADYINITGSESITISGNIYQDMILAGVTVDMDETDDVVRLTGSNSYLGATTVNGGTLSWECVNAQPGLVRVNNAGSVLSGTGTIPDEVTMNDATILAPGLNGGADVGTLTINGFLIFNNESKYEVTVTGGAADRIVAGSYAVAMGGAANVEIQPGYDTAGLALPATIMDVAGAYMAFDESALPPGWNIDDAPVGTLIRITAVGGASPVTIPTYNEWGMIVAFLLLSVGGIRRMRKKSSGKYHTA